MFKKSALATSLLLSLTACSTMFTPACSGGDPTALAGQFRACDKSQEDSLCSTADDRVFFDKGDAILSAEAKATLDTQASWLKKHPETKITIQGYSDSHGSHKHNLAIGKRRAVAVEDYLVKTGIRSDRISVVSFGEDHPAVLGDDEASRAQNRRAVTVISD